MIFLLWFNVSGMLFVVPFSGFSVFWRIFHFPVAHCHLSSQGLSVFGSKENSECLWKYLSPENVKVNVCGVKELGSWGEFSTACGGFPPHRSLSPCPISHIPVVLSLSAQSLKLLNGQSKAPDSLELTRQSPNQVIVWYNRGELSGVGGGSVRAPQLRGQSCTGGNRVRREGKGWSSCYLGKIGSQSSVPDVLGKWPWYKRNFWRELRSTEGGNGYPVGFILGII